MKVRSILVIANTEKYNTQEVAQQIKEYCKKYGITVTLFFYDKVVRELPEFDKHDAAVTLGGDGTVLFASRRLAGLKIPILPINFGNFGFISEAARDAWKECLHNLIRGTVHVESRLMIDVLLIRKEKELCRLSGLNDAVVYAEGISRMVMLTVYLESYYLGTYRADGVIVATPTGSTAYSVSAGGPILHPEMNAVVINPICPFTLSHRPLVLPAENTIKIVVNEKQHTNVAMSVDGQNLHSLKPHDILKITASKKRTKILRASSQTFYEALRKKLSWSGGSHD